MFYLNVITLFVIILFICYFLCYMLIYAYFLNSIFNFLNFVLRPHYLDIFYIVSRSFFKLPARLGICMWRVAIGLFNSRCSPNSFHEINSMELLRLFYGLLINICTFLSNTNYAFSLSLLLNCFFFFFFF